MWVYSRQLLEKRLLLNQALGFWLDYWLFLFADDTHSVWCTRPFGISAVAQTILEIQGSIYDRGLRLQMKLEMLATIRRLPYLPIIPPIPTELLDAESNLWSASWLSWCEDVMKIDHMDIVDNYIQALSRALTTNDLPTVTFLSRSLAAELGSDNWSKGQLFNEIKDTICDSDLFVGKEFDSAAFIDHLRTILLKKENMNFEVMFTTTPAQISREIVDTFRAHPSYRTKLITEINTLNERLLTGFIIQVKAAHPHLAAMRALERAKKVMRVLRIRYYLPTHLYGAAKVSTVSNPDVTLIGLPQPFWPKATGRRRVPHLPENPGSIVSKLDADEKDRWYAAVWHLSEAFAGWNEDVHTAAAKVWQALESFAPRIPGSSRDRVFSLAEQYSVTAPVEIVKFLSYRVGVQHYEFDRVFKAKGRACDWYYWNAKQVDLESWLSRVLNPSSYNYYAKWHEPIAPDAIFHPTVGVLQIMARKMMDVTKESWMEKRVKDDLALLYGLRNRIVHRGSRVLPTRMADYLGRLGAEILLALMERQESQAEE